jgi:hypothetical protein
MIQHYQGSAALVDARVMCVRPIITNATLSFENDLPRLEGQIYMPAELRYWPADSRKGISWRLRMLYPEDPMSLNCTIRSPPPSTQYQRRISNYYHESDWQVSLSRSWSTHTLIPETVEMEYGRYYSPAVH